MSNKTLGVILIVVGILIVIAVIVLSFSGFHALGIGAGFGLKKIVLGLVGVIVAIYGVYKYMRVTSPNSDKPQ
jgi:uncharacterized membrane protein